MFCEYSNLEYVRIHVIYRGHQEEYGIHILVVAPQEYVSIYSLMTCSMVKQTRACVSPAGTAAPKLASAPTGTATSIGTRSCSIVERAPPVARAVSDQRAAVAFPANTAT